ncbi:chemotaxis protein CheB [Phosphitispora fastidiosa]|uniref:chemotaxis protein CheB n=1 Tax=Phosphitispora fastidiosa TaxID=2837202 RepID=UPI001E48B679|nr:chemotaxis protein CheB [Phosphitispora fastidiosa]MBU7005167.1 two-component system CheB/CheR fusion protein [Phosphitispora fastidiosa]
MGSRKTICPIVGVGASAGGLESFSRLLRNLPVDTGMAFVLVQHMEPKHKSILADILSRTTNMPVIDVKNKTVVKPDHIYVIPAGMDATVLKGTLYLVPRTEKVSQYKPIDTFLESLAKNQNGTPIGVILSGNGTDGSQGLRAIKTVGGITFAQTPESSKYDGMPQSAITLGAVDFVLTPEEIAGKLGKIACSGVLKKIEIETDELFNADELNKVFMMLYTVSGTNFAEYKQLTIQRRILRRMGLHLIQKLDDYVDYLGQNPAEVAALHQDLLINVTSFFRDFEAFETLKKLIFPSIMENRTPDETVRVWVPGCSTGEEAYSIAIFLTEYLESIAINIPIQIFATDVNETVIERARAGIYPRTIENDVSSERLRRFFVKVEEGYQINRKVRDMCIFARQDISKDPPFSRLDMISCRNVMIYLGPVLQKKMFAFFHYALKPKGFLFLGTSESVGVYSDLFDLADKKYKIYLKKSVSTPLIYDCPFNEYAPTIEKIEVKSQYPAAERLISDVKEQSDRIVINKFAPAGVIINEALEVIQFRGHTGAYLEHASGTPSLNLLKMARDGLLLGLRAAVNQAKKENRPFTKEGLHVIYNGQSKIVSVHVIPIEESSYKARYFLVLFENAALPTFSKGWNTHPNLRRKGQIKQQDENREIVRLKEELIVNKEYLHSVIDQHESANEALRAANEEIQSSNEELQSMNEELETAKEELQSINEELMTLNDELHHRNQELNDINSDVQNLFRCIDIPVVILTGALCIRRFNYPAEKLLNLIATDVGRPISNINPNVNIPDLEQEILEVIDKFISKEKEVQDKWGFWYSMQIRPYKTAENKINGVVLTFVDIDALKNSLTLSQEACEYAEAIVETVREPLLVLDANLHLTSANMAFYHTFRVTPEETRNQLIFDMGNGQWNIPRLRELLTDILCNNTIFTDFKVEYDFPNIGRRTMLVNARPIITLKTRVKLILMAIEDITDGK